MNVMETVTIINKSGKVVSTGKHLINIFKEAKDAYKEKKASLQAEHEARVKDRSTQKSEQAREDTRSEASSRHSKSSRRSHRHRKHRDGDKPPLTEHNLFQIDEDSVVSSSRRSHRGDGSLKDQCATYRSPYLENGNPSQISLVRRHTDFPMSPKYNPTQSELSIAPPPSYHTSCEPPRRNSFPELPPRDTEYIDMDLAYGPIPHHTSLADPNEEDQEQVAETMSRLDKLLLEAHCVQHTASAMMSNLQAKPEAMAAVALTLAELSSLLTKMSPGIIASLKAGSPAIFALLASPQFLIAGGLAFGVTVVMFGGFKIIKHIQAGGEATKRLEEPLSFGPRTLPPPPEKMGFEPEIELSSIDSWRRGIAEAEIESIGTSVDGEFITPEAAKQNKERGFDNDRVTEAESVVSGRSRRSSKTVKSAKSVKSVGSESTVRPKHPPAPRSSVSSKAPVSEAGTRTSRRSEKGRRKEIEPRSSSSTAGLMVLFKKGKKEKGDRESVLSIRPRTVEI